MAAIMNDDKQQLMEMNQQFAPIVAKWMCAYLECSDEVRMVVNEMVEIISDNDTDEDDREMAVATLLEALFPSMHNGGLGGDLEELDAVSRDNNPRFADTSAKMDAQEAAFGERVQKLMTEKGMTQAALASKTGVNQSAISMLLNRGTRPQRRTVEKIAKALGVQTEEIWQE